MINFNKDTVFAFILFGVYGTIYSTTRDYKALNVVAIQLADIRITCFAHIL